MGQYEKLRSKTVLFSPKIKDTIWSTTIVFVQPPKMSFMIRRHLIFLIPKAKKTGQRDTPLRFNCCSKKTWVWPFDPAFFYRTFGWLQKKSSMSSNQPTCFHCSSPRTLKRVTTPWSWGTWSSRWFGSVGLRNIAVTTRVICRCEWGLWSYDYNIGLRLWFFNNYIVF